MKSILISGAASFHGDPPEQGPAPIFAVNGTIEPLPEKIPPNVETIDASGCVVVPGLVNAHHHLYSALARGMPAPTGKPPTSFVEILERVWWRLDRALDLDLVETSATAGALESLCAGVTGIVDHHASPRTIAGSLDRVAGGIRRAGARGVVCYETTDRHGDAGFAAGLAENERFLARATPSGDVRAMVGAHAPFTLSDDHLADVARLAHRHGVAAHLHLAEDVVDQDDARRRGATGVGERLSRTGLLEGPLVFAHGVHLSGVERAQLRAAGAFLTHQPRSNMNNHVGYCAGARDLGDRVALGTDGVCGDILGEAAAAYFRLREHDRDGAAETVWSWLAGGWRLLSAAFGLPPDRGFGRLVEGAPCDLVVLNYDAPTPVTAANLPWHLAFGITSRHVRDVVVAGEVVVRERRPTRIDATLAREAASAAATRLWRAMESL